MKELDSVVPAEKESKRRAERIAQRDAMKNVPAFLLGPSLRQTKDLLRVAGRPMPSITLHVRCCGQIHRITVPLRGPVVFHHHREPGSLKNLRVIAALDGKERNAPDDCLKVLRFISPRTQLAGPSEVTALMERHWHIRRARRYWKGADTFATTDLSHRLQTRRYRLRGATSDVVARLLRASQSYPFSPTLGGNFLNHGTGSELTSRPERVGCEGGPRELPMRVAKRVYDKRKDGQPKKRGRDVYTEEMRVKTLWTLGLPTLWLRRVHDRGLAMVEDLLVLDVVVEGPRPVVLIAKPSPDGDVHTWAARLKPSGSGWRVDLWLKLSPPETGPKPLPGPGGPGLGVKAQPAGTLEARYGPAGVAGEGREVDFRGRGGYQRRRGSWHPSARARGALSRSPPGTAWRQRQQPPPRPRCFEGCCSRAGTLSRSTGRSAGP